MSDELSPDQYRSEADGVFEAMLARVGEGSPRPRLEPTRRVVELLGDPHRAAPVIHLTGTNGKTSTSRLVEAILTAHDLRVGTLTSPHLERFTERIRIDGAPITDEAVVRNWLDIEPYVGMVDAELETAGESTLTFFEVLTVLAFAAFADAPVDVVVLEVGMGGEWDSTNVADAAVAVFTPIDLDHQSRLGRTVEEIARTKSGIVKPGSAVVSALQQPVAEAVLRDAAARMEGTIAYEGDEFAVLERQPAVGGQLVSVRGLAGEYRDLVLPLFGAHQAENAAVAIAAVESFLGAGTVPLNPAVLAAGLAAAASPGRLQVIGNDPAIVVDAAHNPHGARALVAALAESFGFDDLVIVFGSLADKDARGIVEALAPTGARFLITPVESERALPAEELGEIVADVVGPERVNLYETLDDALDDARRWADSAEDERTRGILVTGSIVLVGEAMAIAEDREWGGA
ncbi:bifunctional folylpolyglutamate synthase/dihydrofolate synthase [Agromyces seonyuensis]|uniref:tetrahydrofolate synthase n=1 Tax=Agromyces seonyuensis TaxID=2662446 RepID=A0A6I4NZD7_9MICO|nr:folylpolyglutamate synthase/dihydrofolate synthase family protein [Agromyces seonyuensis]MWB97795.1 dihydrofolate synthase [Agromyces seonyuensis]